MSDSIKMTRHAQRKSVFELVFESFFRTDETPSDIYLSEAEDRGFVGYDYIRDTFLCVEEYAKESDELIRAYTVGWSFDRLSITAKSVLRLAIYEMTHTDVPPKVVINEAVEISKEYASEEEAAFVNGILNKLARDKRLIEDGSGSDNG